MMRTASQRLFAQLTVVVDMIMIVLSFIVAYFFRFSGMLPLAKGVPPLTHYLYALIGIIPVYLWFFREARLYQPTRHVRRIEEIFLVIKSITYAIIILMAVTFFYRRFSYSRLFLVNLWFFSCILISLGRYMLIQWEYYRKKSKKEISKLLIIGSTTNTRDLLRWAKNNPHYGYEPIGILSNDPDHVGKHLDDIPILGVTKMWESFVRELRPDQVVLLDPAFSREAITELVVACEDEMIELKIGPDAHGLIAHNVGVEYISNVPLLGFKPLPLDDFWNRFNKRFFDLIFSGLMLLGMFPFGLIVAWLIRLEGKGPVFYFQERVGRDGKVFRLIKFRTMKVDAEKETGPIWAKADDDRKTGIGKFLRRWNIDELPQLINVFKGEMSLVGPRPERPHFVDQFRESIPRYMARHKIKSGLTGWAQVHGLRGNTSIEERIKYDLYYMENWSLLLDIEILIMTLFAFKNAY